MDYFTKLAVAFPIRDHKAQSDARVLLENVFSRFGMNEELLTDQGPNWKASYSRNYVKHWISERFVLVHTEHQQMAW